jgi:hypothetical protein
MARPSTSCALLAFEINEDVNEALDDDVMGQCSSGDDRYFDGDYT